MASHWVLMALISTGNHSGDNPILSRAARPAAGRRSGRETASPCFRSRRARGVPFRARPRPSLTRRGLVLNEGRVGDDTRLDDLFLLVDDDPRRHHQQDTLRLAAVADVLEETVEVRNLTQDRRPELVAALRQALQAAQE